MEELDKTINTGFTTETLNAKFDKIKLIEQYEAEKAIILSNTQITVTTDIQRWVIKNKKIIEQEETRAGGVDLGSDFWTCEADAGSWRGLVDPLATSAPV